MARERRGVLLKAGLASAILLFLVGCGARTEYLATNFDIERLGWDTVRVEVNYAARTVVGGANSIEADSTVITVFDSRYDTLYSGAQGIVALPDALLGDRERLMIEACGLVKRRQICAQQYLESSPKRVSVAEEIRYPFAGRFEEGSYDLSFLVDRRNFDGDGWERIAARESVSGHLLVWVNDPEAKTRGAVRIPFSGTSGRFDLRRYSNYRNFKYYLESELLDHQAASVTFEIHAGLSDAALPLASTEKEVRRKTDDIRALEVRHFAEQASEMIIDELGSSSSRRAAYAYVIDWRFTSMDRKYHIELELEWDGSRFSRGRYELVGTLEVGEDGAGAAFHLESGNRRAIRAWRDRNRRDTLQFRRFDVYREDVAAALM